jgi:hypothetical protein
VLCRRPKRGNCNVDWQQVVFVIVMVLLCVAVLRVYQLSDVQVLDSDCSK